MKESQYNIWVERGDFSYVYNGITGALLRVSHEDRSALRQFIEGNDEAPSQLLS